MLLHTYPRETTVYEILGIEDLQGKHTEMVKQVIVWPTIKNNHGKFKGTERAKGSLGLRLLGKGDLFSEVADLHGVSKSTVCLVFEAFIDALNESIDNIRFPQASDEQYANKVAFYRKCRIPGVLGAVDGTLVPIIAHSQQEEVYRCRKGYHALNVQAVVNSNFRFLDVVLKWPGSQHDSAIFNSFGLKINTCGYKNTPYNLRC